METSQETSLSWCLLPGEIRNLILTCLDQDFDGPEGVERYRKTGYSLVCREWASFFEWSIFKNLCIASGARLDQLEEILVRNPQRQAHIKFVRFIIELPEYDCTTCAAEDPAKSERNNGAFTRAMTRLVHLMSTWEHAAPGSITLTLLAYSKSDREHSFKLRWLDPPHSEGSLATIGVDRERLLQEVQQRYPGDEPYHHWAGGKPTGYLGRRWERRQISQSLGLRLPEGHELPLVKCVWQLIFAWEGDREIGPRHLATLLNSSFPSVTHLRWETKTRVLQSYIRGILWVLGERLPKSVISVSLFEDDRGWDKTVPRYNLTGDLLRDWNKYMRRDSRSWQSICFVTRATRADWFFEPYRYEMSLEPCLQVVKGAKPLWPNLQYLSLQMEVPRTFPELSELMTMVAHAALHMPKLKVLELWDSEPGHLTYFSWEPLASGRGRVFWESTRKIEAKPGTAYRRAGFCTKTSLEIVWGAANVSRPGNTDDSRHDVEVDVYEGELSPESRKLVPFIRETRRGIVPPSRKVPDLITRKLERQILYEATSPPDWHLLHPGLCRGART